MPQDNPFPNLGGLTYSEDVFYRILDDFLSTGVVGATDYQVIQNHLGANMSVDVQPGSAYVAFTSVAGGKRRTRLPAQSNSGTPGSPNSADKWLTTFVAADVTNPRIDRVVLTVRDTSLDGSGASDSALRVIAGTPTAGATTANLNGAAAVPANSILLANVLVPANATTVITANIANVATRSKIGVGNLAGSIVTSTMAGGPPTTPNDGDIWVATAVDANGTRWMFQYNAGSASVYKWEFIGGDPAFAAVDAGETTASAAYTALTTAGPSFTLPRDGDYIIEHGGTIAGPINAGPGFASIMSYDVGATGAVDTDGVQVYNPINSATAIFNSVSRKRLKTGLTAVSGIVAKYKSSSGTTATFAVRWLSVVPVRIR